MASQDGPGEPATTGRRRRSLYEELGLSVDLFEDAALPPQATASAGDVGYSRAGAHRQQSEADETESFIAALRDNSPPIPGRADRAALSFGDTGVRPAFEDGPNSFAPLDDHGQERTAVSFSTGDLAPAGAAAETERAEIELYPSPRVALPLTGSGTDAYSADTTDAYSADTTDAYSADTTDAYTADTTDAYTADTTDAYTADISERRSVDRTVIDSLLPVDALAPIEPSRDAKSAKKTSAELTAESVLRQRRDQPGRGWRRTVFALSGGFINLGPSAAEVRERELINRARTPLRGCHRLAIISLKGGVGKTTTTVSLGSMFATLRGDRVIAMDANPDRGTLGEKIPRTSPRTVRDLVHNAARLTRYADVRDFTSQAPSRLEVLASEADPFVSMAFSETDYRVGVGILESFYNLILTDCGTGLLHSAMVGVLGLSDSLIVVSSASLDGARSAAATLDWLEHHGYDALVRQSVAVISTVHPTGGNVDVSKLEEHFASRCRAVVRIPFDPHLEAGGIIDLDELEQPTYDAYLRLAAEVGDGFAARPRIG